MIGLTPRDSLSGPPTPEDWLPAEPIILKKDHYMIARHVCLITVAVFSSLGASGATLTGTEEELAAHFAQQRQTVHLSATSIAKLSPTGAIVRGMIDAEGKTLSEAHQTAQTRTTALTGAVKAGKLELASTYSDPDASLDLEKTKRVNLRTEFSIGLEDPAKVDATLLALAGLEGVSVTGIEALYVPDPDLGLRLMKSAMSDLERQRAFYADAFHVELRLQGFLPFSEKETGGGDEEIVELSPFSVSPSIRWRRGSKSRNEEVVVQRQFLTRDVTKTVSAVFEIFPQE